MTTAQVGIRSGNVIVPYVSTTKRTKAIALTSSDVTAGTNLSNLIFKAGYITCYADSAGNWFAEGNFSLTIDFANAAIWVLNLPNLVCKSGTGYYQEVSLQSAVGVFLNIYASGSAITLESAGNLSGNTKYVFAAFKLALNAEPTTYTTAANMEGVIAADVYIPPAAAGSQGIINNLAGNTVGNPIKGKTDGVAIADGYVGEIFGTEVAGAGGNGYRFFVDTVATTAGITVLPTVLNKGVYLVGWMVMQRKATGDAADRMETQLRIGTTAVITTYSNSVYYAESTMFTSGTMPVEITADTTTIDLHIHMIAATATAAENRLWIMRIG